VRLRRPFDADGPGQAAPRHRPAAVGGSAAAGLAPLLPPPALATSERRRRGLVLALSLACFAASAALLIAFHRWTLLDLHVYRWGGLLARRSGDLYSGRFWDPLGFHLRFTYPPIAALIFALLSAVPPALLDGLVTAASLAALLGTLWLTWGKLGYRRSASRVAATLAATSVALWLQPVQQTLNYGQINLILMLVVVADLTQPEASRARGIGVGLAAGFKLTPLIFIPYLLLTRRFRAAAVALATFALTIAVSFAVLPAQSDRYWLSGLFMDSRRAGSNAGVSNQSLNGALARLLDSLSASHPYWIAAAALTGAVGLMLAARAARRGHAMLGIVTCAITGLLVSPISWAHHWVWIAPALVVAADLALRAGAAAPRWRLAAWAGVAALATPFFFLPQRLVPWPTISNIRAHPAPLVAGNLYVITAIAVLGVVGVLVLPRSGQVRGRGDHDHPRSVDGRDRAWWHARVQ
jgi:alpha-1,2-mannosyltransferase